MEQRATFGTETRSRSLRGELAPKSVPIRAVDVPLVTELPKSAQSGDVVRLRPSLTAGAIWRLVYLPELPAGGRYPWFADGAQVPIGEFAVGAFNSPGSSYAYVSGAPQFSIPYPGIYQVYVSAQISPPNGSSGTGAEYVEVVPAGAGLTASINNGLLVGDGTAYATVSKEASLELSDASDEIEMQFRHNASTAGAARRVRLTVAPGRIGRP